MNFLILVSIFEASGWQALGKIPNPVNGKTEPNLPAVENTIEILILLREKSRGNLTPEEEKYLSAAIANLQLNYAAEKEKPQTSAVEKEGAEKEGAEKEGDTKEGATKEDS